MADIKEGSERSVNTRSEESLREAGRKGAEGLNRDPQKKSEDSKKGTATGGHDSLTAAGRESGKHSHGRKRNEEEED